MLQALLASAELTPNDVTIVEYPDFGQGAAVAQGAVDAATGFANNEPVQLELAGTPGDRPARRRHHAAARTRDSSPSTATHRAKHDAVAGFVRATLKAMNEIAANPAIGVDAAIKAVPDLGQGPGDAGGDPRRDDRRLAAGGQRRPARR